MAPDANGIPAWVNFVVRVGVPAAIAVWFVWRLTTTMEDRLLKMEQIQQTVHIELQEHMRNSSIAIDLARQICVNAGKDDAEKRACLIY